MQVRTTLSDFDKYELGLAERAVDEDLLNNVARTHEQLETIHGRLLTIVFHAEKWQEDKDVVEDWRQKYEELILKSSWSKEALGRLEDEINSIYREDPGSLWLHELAMQIDLLKIHANEQIRRIREPYETRSKDCELVASYINSLRTKLLPSPETCNSLNRADWIIRQRQVSIIDYLVRSGTSLVRDGEVHPLFQMDQVLHRMRTWSPPQTLTTPPPFLHEAWYAQNSLRKFRPIARSQGNRAS